ncbi:hypothetical protein [Ornithinimicrobium sufpigmenti]|uniref:sunset domain-containing protein n=1 Tax=Ornithinimicrobium sufpigmenti TaxID=2508882 RepID=UPI0010360944|nr:MULTISPECIES: hypothetical protein [unclassified Ornithinimicrobium]
MDNSTTTWIIVALLVLLIGAAIFMLLRRPGGDDSLDGSGTPAVGRDSDRPATDRPDTDRPDTDRPDTDRPDTDRRGDLGGRTAPEETQGVAAVETPARDDAPFDQTTYDAPAGTGGATPVDRADVEDRAVMEDSYDEGYAASSTQPATGGTTEAARPADDFFGVDREPREEVEPDPQFQDPRTDGHLIADEARHEEMADRPAAGVQDEPLTADEVLDARDVGDRDQGDGYAAPPVPAEPIAAEPVEPVEPVVHEEPVAAEPVEPVVAEPLADEPAVDEPAAEEQQQEAPVGGHVFAESVYGAGSVEPAEDGSGPQGWEVKGNTGSMLFHTADSPSYDAVRAEVWFDSEETARNAGFAHWDRRRR